MTCTFCPKNKFLWDIWFIEDKKDYHAFYLQAKRIKDPEKRHNENVSIGHAISKDLKTWKELPTALKPGIKGSWDDSSLWTGNVIKKGKKYYMFYTGRHKDTKSIQKIGLATSDNLTDWKRSKNNPILESDIKYYTSTDKKNRLGKLGAWRDPFVFKDPKSKKYYMTISARKKSKKTEYNGCIAIAESDDLLNWKILPPILAPGKYDEMETSQLIHHKGIYYLFFSVAWRSTYEPRWKKKVGTHTGLHCYYSKSLFGKYKPVNRNGVVVEDATNIYDIRLIHKKADKYIALGWLNKDKKKKFIGKMSIPFEIRIDKDKVELIG